MAKVTKDMIIGDILKLDPTNGIAQILMQYNMRCAGCPNAARESLQDTMHNVDVDAIVDEINVYLESVGV